MTRRQPKLKPWATWPLARLSPADEAEIEALSYAPRAVGANAARQLRALCWVVRPRYIVEVGTLVGMSTRAMRAVQWTYTCDTGEPLTKFKQEDCVTTHWRTTSTDMLKRLVKNPPPGGVDLVFYDGKVQRNDLALLRQLTHENTVFAFHDYVDEEKGVRGVRALQPLVPSHKLIVPADPKVHTVAVLAPETLAREIVAA